MKTKANKPKGGSSRLAASNVSGRGETQFPGILADAKALDVSRVHLWLVLTGRRKSARLAARYEQLKRDATETAK
ncbi:hypothetical protein [Horticoccus sp. 23ND18S-11]|uniref:hypothetical protein n=1 Tax=Horticoccus sp. 23ND18S-11 TaxID=3391832 RepID=UPI0039C9DF0F